MRVSLSRLENLCFYVFFRSTNAVRTREGSRSCCNSGVRLCLSSVVVSVPTRCLLCEYLYLLCEYLYLLCEYLYLLCKYLYLLCEYLYLLCEYLYLLCEYLCSSTLKTPLLMLWSLSVATSFW